MSSKFKVGVHDLLKWPNRCTLCGGNATTSYLASFYTFAGMEFYGSFAQKISYCKHGISYPICTKHRYTPIIIRLFYYISIIALYIFGILTFAFLYPVWSKDLGFTLQGGIIVCFIFLISIIAFIAFKKLQPVRLKNIGIHFSTIIIRNEEYGKEFALLNNLKVLQK